MKKLYDALLNNPTTSTAAGTTFEYRGNQYNSLRMTGLSSPSLLFPWVRNVVYKHYTTNIGVAGKQFILPESKELVFADDPSTPLEVDTYYRPRNTAFPAIDSWLLAGPAPQDPATFLRFQITLDKDEHDVNHSGLIGVDKLIMWMWRSTGLLSLPKTSFHEVFPLVEQ